MKFIYIVFLLFCYQAFAINLWKVTDYKENDSITVFVNAVFSARTQIPIDYYSLPVCKPEVITTTTSNLGSILSGSEVSNTPFAFTMYKNEEKPIVTCKKVLTDAESTDYKQHIQEEYNVQWLIDDFPAATVVYHSDDTDDYHFEDSHPIGYVNSDTDKICVFNHISFAVDYHPAKNGVAHIVGFQANPSSIHYVERNNQIESDNKNSNDCQTVESGETIYYTYDVTFKESTTVWGSRWDLYLYGSNKAGVHWFSLANSLFMVIFLSTIVAIIIMRTLARDITRYNSVSQEEREEAIEEGGWKLIHGDVFRKPCYAQLFSIVVGSGAQIFWTVICVCLGVSIGFLNPSHRGDILTATLFIFIALGYVSGYSSSRMYNFFKGKQRKLVTFESGLLFPGIVGLIILLMNGLWYATDSTQFIHFSTILTLLALWFGISLPLVYLGSFFGYSKEPYAIPTRVNHIPRQIPPTPWYLSTWVKILVGGSVPFGTIFLELYLMMSSVFLHQTYVMFGFLLAVIAITFVTTAEISIVICYFQLASEDYNWWWTSIYSTGSSAIYFFIFSIYYLVDKLNMASTVSVVLYLFLMLILCIFVFLTFGTIGFYTDFWFVRQIYSSLKVD